MKNNFVGSKDLSNVYDSYTASLEKSYDAGKHVMLAGTLGVGKTFVSCAILKKACNKNFHALYTTLSDVISVLIDAPHDERFLSRYELLNADFLVIDEFDSRYVANGAADLFGRTVENVLRTRIQNGLPTILCTNSPNVLEMFNGPIKDALSSLMNKIQVVPIVAKDHRKEQSPKEMEEKFLKYIEKTTDPLLTKQVKESS